MNHECLGVLGRADPLEFDFIGVLLDDLNFIGSHGKPGKNWVCKLCPGGGGV
jgi:hypothetical protein